MSVATRNVIVARQARILSEATRRARKLGSGGKVSAEALRQLRRVLGVACLKCGSRRRPTWDHIRPLARDGRHHPANLQPLCRPCNEKKQASTADYRTAAQRRKVASLWRIEFKPAAEAAKEGE